jgi:16S rRNA processing protein RimM
MAGELVEIGQVTRPHGVRGELRITPFTRSPESFCQYDRIIIQSEGQAERLVQVKQARPHKTGVLLQLENVRNRAQAESLVGATLLVKREWLPETEADE